MLKYISGVIVWMILLTAALELLTPMVLKNGWLPEHHHNPHAARNRLLLACIPVIRLLVLLVLIFGAIVPKDKMPTK